VNIVSFFEVSKAAIKHMKPGSTIINTGSIQAYDPSHPILDYACTKVRVSG
jgi:short-subunit dehydrogenase